MGHLVGERSKLAQTEYKHGHDNVARMVHWNIAHSYGLDVSSKWYEHRPEGVIENDQLNSSGTLTPRHLFTSKREDQTWL